MKARPSLSNTLIFVLGLCCTLLIGFRFQYLRPMPDSDQYFHFALSRMMQDRGVLISLPAIEGLGWGERFPDKEFFFHILTSIAYYFGQDQGVSTLVVLLAGLSIALLSLTSFRICHKPVFAILLSLSFLPLDTFFIHRIFLVRPHVLAILVFVCLLASLLSRNRFLVFSFSLLYSLSYHAIYIPLCLTTVFYLTSLYRNESQSTERKVGLELMLCSVSAIAIGILCHPAFPSNVQIMIEHLMFALVEDGSLNIGSEVKSIGLLETLFRSPFVYAILFPALFYQVAKRRQLELLELSIFYCCIVFLLITIKSPRGIEYLLPLAVVLISQLVSKLDPKIFRCLLVFYSLLFLVMSVPKLSWIVTLKSPSYSQGRLAALRAAKAISREANDEQTRIFNCSYNTAPYALYAVSNSRIIDILDPRLLISKNKKLHQSRELLLKNPPKNITAEINKLFESNYVICRNSRLTKLLDKTPGVRRLYPQNKEQTAAVLSYKLDKE